MITRRRLLEAAGTGAVLAGTVIAGAGRAWSQSALEAQAQAAALDLLPVLPAGTRSRFTETLTFRERYPVSE